MAHGATTNDFQIRELSRPNQLRIQLGMSMEEKGHPFYQMPERTPKANLPTLTKAIHALIWLVNTLESADLTVSAFAAG